MGYARATGYHHSILLKRMPSMMVNGKQEGLMAKVECSIPIVELTSRVSFEMDVPNAMMGCSSILTGQSIVDQ